MDIKHGELSAYYFSNTDNRISVHESQYETQGLDYVMLNPTRLTPEEIDDIIGWCSDKNCVYYPSGIIKINNKSLLLEFVLRWS